MEVYIVGSNEKQKFLGLSTRIAIARIGERIHCGYAPAAEVTDVLYAYEENQVYIKLDGPIF